MLKDKKLGNLYKTQKIAAFVLSDLHLRMDAPACRAEKGDRWLPTLKGYLNQVNKALQETPNSYCLCAGDVFHDGWRTQKCPPELINFTVKNFPRKRRVYAIPGQHDLPHHNLADLHKSAFWTLCSTGTLTYMNPGVSQFTGQKFTMVGFPWGCRLEKPSEKPHELSRLTIALLHRYVWKDGHVHPGAADKDNVHVVQSDLERLGYDIGIAGDNHSGFVDENFLVPGAFYRSRADEVDYKPAIGAIYEDGSIVRYFLDVSNDEFVNDEELAVLLTSKGTDTAELVEALRNYKKVSSDFFDMVEFYAKKQRASEAVKQIITDIKDKAGEK